MADHRSAGAPGPRPDGAVAAAEADGVIFAPGEVAARLDRLPLTGIHWRLSLITQLAWGVVVAGDGYAALLYPYVWNHDFSHFAYSWLNAVQVGVGILIGEYAGGYLADWFGRRRIMAVGCALAGLFILVTPLAAPHYLGLMLLSLGQSTGIGFVLATNALYMHEIVPPKWRGRLTMGAQSTTIIWGLLGLAAGYYWIPSHYKLYLVVIGIAGLLATGLILTLPESPRWLEAKGRSAEARQVLAKIEDAVRRRTGTLPEPDPAAMNERQVGVTDRVPVREIFQGDYLRRTLVLIPAWVLGYSGIVYGFGAYQAIQLITYGFSAQSFIVLLMVMYGPAYAAGVVFFAFFNERFERRTLIMVGALIFSASFIIIWVFSYVDQVNAMQYVGYALTGIGSALWLFNMYNYTSAAYPTRLRSTATGITDGLGHLGAIFGPVVVVALGDATSKHGFYGFMLYCAIAGALVPALLVRFLGMRQRDAVLEVVAT
jgi:MFS family permease